MEELIYSPFRGLLSQKDITTSKPNVKNFGKENRVLQSSHIAPQPIRLRMHSIKQANPSEGQLGRLQS